ncbi:hypothetical protein DFJ74DRAFT_41550 [Hyaloraphidium curvatum]|nr:hypothetical protein DFJ74DRAFT_41550 [Hyaloraphidium curvatum]
MAHCGLRTCWTLRKLASGRWSLPTAWTNEGRKQGSPPQIQAVIDKTLPLFREYGYQPPFDLPPSPQPQTAVAEPKTPTNLFSPPPPKSAHLPDTPVAGGRESNASASTMSAPRTPAVLKEFRRVEEETWEDSPSMETLAGGLSQKGLEILREGSLGAPGTPDHRQYQEPEAPPTVSPPREAHYEEMGEPVARLPTAQDAEPTAATIPAALGDFDAASPSSPDYRRADSDEMEDTFANLNLQHDFPIARGREPPSVPRGRPSFYQADDIDNTFSSLPPRPHVPATPHTTSRIPVLTPRAPVSDSLYPLLAPISEEEYEDAMDAFGRRATPLDWLNECVAQVNEALTDVRFDMADDGAASEWREVTVKELEVMLDMPEGKCMGFVAACLKLNRLAPATKKGQKAYRIIE